MTTTSTAPALTDEVRADLDQAIDELATGAERWAALSLSDRAALLQRTFDSVGAQAQRWADTAIAAKHTPKALAGEEYLSGPYVTLANLAGVARSLTALAEGKSPTDGLTFSTAPGGRATARVLPGDAKEWLLLNGFTAEVWFEPGVSPDEVRREAGLGARAAGEAGGVGVVLGAGNISSIGPLDVLYELVAHNRVSVLKLNPTFASLQPVLTDALAPLVQAGLVRVVNGAADVGAYLTGHPKVAHVHITGSGITHDAIVWGTDAQADKRRNSGEPALDKEITSELGGVSPIIVVPGEWSTSDIAFQAENVVTQRLHNAGHNCIAGQALIVSADWPQREEFLAEVRRLLDTVPAREPWYPGSDGKVGAARASYPDAEDHQGRLLIEVSDATSQDLLTTEYFSPVLGHIALPGTGAEFLRAAVDFANDKLDGTLGASLIVDPGDRKKMGPAFDTAIADLRYGTIAINAWSAFGFLAHALPWGAYPGNTIDAVGSGIGVVHNSHLLPRTERAVITGPFRPFPRSILAGELAMSPRPPWFVTAKTAPKTAQLLTQFGAAPTWRKIPQIVVSALRG